MIKILKKHTTSEGNELEFYVTDLLPEKSIVVRDNSCQLERLYTVGKLGALSFDDKQTVKSIDDVVNAWINEEIHF